MTSLTLAASVANLTVSTGADFGAASNGAEGEFLETMTLSAAGGATLDFGDGQTIHLDTITDSTTDLTATISLTTGTSSTANIGTVDNQYGAIDLTVTAGGTATTVDALTAATISVTASGSGNVNLGTMTSTTTTTIDASALGGELTVSAAAVGSTATITTGSGGVTSITTANGATTATNITLGSENGVNDHVIMNGTVSGLISLTNFNAGATNGDSIDISVVGIEGRDMLGGTEDLILAGNAGTLTAATQTVVIADATTTLDLGTAATATMVRIDGDYATTGLVETAIEASGSRELTVNGAVTAATDIMLIIYDDGTNSYLATLTTSADIADNGNFASGNATVTNVITFVGVADCTDLTAANLGAALIA